MNGAAFLRVAGAEEEERQVILRQDQFFHNPGAATSRYLAVVVTCESAYAVH